MSFISYSQNFEDVMLWRALKNIKNGFYIDVGANDPEEYSVTKAFYDAGWSGINIEPMTQYFNKLCNQRSRDKNLPYAIGNQRGTFDLYEIKDTGLSTLDADIAKMQEEMGHTVTTLQVETWLLDDICDKYVQGDIHFLKIDVEGFETQVLEGMKFQKYRPWIVVVETTEPSTGEIIAFPGENILTSHGYKNVYFDGLNSFYIDNDKLAGLEEYFTYPPNVFDRYELISEKKLRENIQKLQGIIQEIGEEKKALVNSLTEKEAQIAGLQMQVADLQGANVNLDNELKAIEGMYRGVCNSYSWRLTYPLRYMKKMVKKLFGL